MVDFLIGDALTEAVRKIAAGRNLQCAVAFWGRGAGTFLKVAGADLSRTRIVCDLSMGGCSPEALAELGAPDNRLLRHYPGLHAKVYLSDRGAVIGSANASDGGLGFAPAGRRLSEAATFHDVKSTAWQAAAEWFDQLHNRAQVLDEAALEFARSRWSPLLHRASQAPVNRSSLLDLVLAYPERFDGIGFVLVGTKTTAEERSRARRSASKSGTIKQEILDKLSDEGMFVGWDQKDVLRWPVSFLEFWMPNATLRIFARTVRGLDPSSGTIFSKRDARSLGRLLPPDCPSFLEAEKTDAARLRLLKKSGQWGLFPTALHLGRALEAL